MRDTELRALLLPNGAVPRCRNAAQWHARSMPKDRQKDDVGLLKAGEITKTSKL